MTIGLALSGGGARGIAHIGVLAALERMGIRPGVIAGTSAGSIVGALYASGKTTDQILGLASRGSLFKNLNIRMPRRGFMDMSYLRKLLTDELGDTGFDDLVHPFYIAVTNLNTGRVEFHNKGPLIELILASCSIPILFKPIEIDGHVYVDGGLTCNLPAAAIRDKCDKLIGVNLVPRLFAENNQLSGMVQIANRCYDLSVLNNIKPALKKCDIIIEPESLSDVSRFSFKKYEKIYKMGFHAAIRQQQTLKQIRFLLRAGN